MSDVKPFVLDFDLVSGFCTSGKVKPTQRRVSDMVAQFANEAAARAMVEGGDPLRILLSLISFHVRGFHPLRPAFPKPFC